MWRLIKMASDQQLTLFGHWFSQPTRSLGALLKLSGVEFTFHNVDLMKGEHKAPEFLAVNPAGQVPAITHGSFSLGESAAIAFYLGEAFHINNQYFPADNAQEKAKINAYLHWHHNNTRKHAAALVYAMVIGPKFFGKPESTEAELVPLRHNLESLLSQLEAILTSGHYVAKTAHATFADLHAYCEFSQLEMINYDFSAYPHFVRWQGEIGALPAVAEVHQPLRGFIAHAQAQAQPAEHAQQ